MDELIKKSHHKFNVNDSISINNGVDEIVEGKVLIIIGSSGSTVDCKGGNYHILIVEVDDTTYMFEQFLSQCDDSWYEIHRKMDSVELKTINHE